MEIEKILKLGLTEVMAYDMDKGRMIYSKSEYIIDYSTQKDVMPSLRVSWFTSIPINKAVLHKIVGTQLVEVGRLVDLLPEFEKFKEEDNNVEK